MGKASLWRVPADHFSTLYDNRTGRPDWWSIAVQALLPLIAGVATWWLGAKIADVGGAVSGISIVAGLLFAMAVFLFQLRITLDNAKHLGEDDFVLVDECMANTLWAILWGGDAGGLPHRVRRREVDRQRFVGTHAHRDRGRQHRPLPARDRQVPQAAPPGVRAHRDEAPVSRNTLNDSTPAIAYYRYSSAS